MIFQHNLLRKAIRNLQIVSVETRYGATTEDNNDEEYVFILLVEQAKPNVKYETLFVDQSKDRKRITKTKNGTSEQQTEKRTSQSYSSRMFANEHSVNKIQKAREIHPGSNT